MDQRVSERVRIEIGRAGVLERGLEDGADLIRVGPMRAVKSCPAEQTVRPRLDPRLRKDRVFRAKAFFGSQERDPFEDNLPYPVADRKEPGREGFRPLGAHLAGVLFEQFMFDVDVLQLEGTMALSRAPVKMAKAISARSRRSISVAAGMASRTVRIWASVG